VTVGLCRRIVNSERHIAAIATDSRFVTISGFRTSGQSNTRRVFVPWLRLFVFAVVLSLVQSPADESADNVQHLTSDADGHQQPSHLMSVIVEARSGSVVTLCLPQKTAVIDDETEKKGTKHPWTKSTSQNHRRIADFRTRRKIKSTNQSVIHEVLEWPNYLKHC